MKNTVTRAMDSELNNFILPCSSCTVIPEQLLLREPKSSLFCLELINASFPNWPQLRVFPKKFSSTISSPCFFHLHSTLPPHPSHLISLTLLQGQRWKASLLTQAFSLTKNPNNLPFSKIPQQTFTLQFHPCINSCSVLLSKNYF